MHLIAFDVFLEVLHWFFYFVIGIDGSVSTCFKMVTISKSAFLVVSPACKKSVVVDGE